MEQIASSLYKARHGTKQLEAKLASIEATQQKAITSLDEIAEPEADTEELSTRTKNIQANGSETGNASR